MNYFLAKRFKDVCTDLTVRYILFIYFCVCCTSNSKTLSIFIISGGKLALVCNLGGEGGVNIKN